MQKIKDWATRTSLKTGVDLVCSVQVGGSYSTSGSRCYYCYNLVINHNWGKARIVITTNGTNLWSFMTLVFSNRQLNHHGDRKAFELMTSTWKKVSKNALDDIDKIAVLFLNIKQHTRRFAIKLRLMFSKEHYIVLRTQHSFWHVKGLM